MTPAASHTAWRVCTRCVHDTSVPGITFDAHGVCNFCHLHDALDRRHPTGDAGRARLDALFAPLRRAGRDRPYDCLVGLSGGRDSTYLLYCAVKRWGLRPLAVHFNDGFGNPVAGENMVKATHALGVPLRTVTSDWREARDLKLAFLQASTPDLNLGTDLGIAAALYSVAVREDLRYILVGQSFRTEGIKPLSWSFFDGTYLRAVHRRFGKVPLRDWRPDDAGFHLGPRELAYYVLRRRIKTLLPFYYTDYVRAEADAVLQRELGWVYPGAHYLDDLYHSLVAHVHRVKFGIDLNLNSDAALVRSGQMTREAALARAGGGYHAEDDRLTALCLKRLGLTPEQFAAYLALPPRTFRDYPSSYRLIRWARLPIRLLSALHLLPQVTYDKYFRCGA